MPGAPTPEPTVAGLVKLSTTDWPGKLAAVVFLQGCPLRCTYCHNKDILDPRGAGVMPWAQVVSFLARRQGLLDGVVFSGGEPLLSAGLPEAMNQIRDLGFEVGLHTSGAWPRRLAALLDNQTVNWVGLDIKHLEHKYTAVTGVPVSGKAAWRSLEAVVASGVPHEVRTTVDPTVHTPADLHALIEQLANYRSANGRAVQHHALQEVRPIPVAFPGWRLDNHLPASAYPNVALQNLTIRAAV
jgi:pyruvate formate lyase activating enzyme